MQVKVIRCCCSDRCSHMPVYLILVGNDLIFTYAHRLYQAYIPDVLPRRDDYLHNCNDSRCDPPANCRRGYILHPNEPYTTQFLQNICRDLRDDEKDAFIKALVAGKYNYAYFLKMKRRQVKVDLTGYSCDRCGKTCFPQEVTTITTKLFKMCDWCYREYQKPTVQQPSDYDAALSLLKGKQ